MNVPGQCQVVVIRTALVAADTDAAGGHMDLLLLVDDGHRAVPRRILGAARVDGQRAHRRAVAGHLHGVAGHRDIRAHVVTDLEGVRVAVYAVASVAVADPRQLGVDLHRRTRGPVRLRAPVGAPVT